MKPLTTVLTFALAVLAHATSAAASDCLDAATAKSIQDWVRRGDCLRAAKQYTASIEAYRRGLAENPAGSRDLHLGMADAYDELGQYVDELRSVQAALQLDSADPEALYALGIAYEQLRDYPLAIENFQKVLTIRPNDNRALRNIGFVLLQQDKPEAALKPLEAAIEIDPNDWKAHLNLSSAYTRTREALYNELQLLSRQGSHEVSKREIELPMKINEFPYDAKALEHSREAARLNPDDFITQYGLGTKLLNDPKALPEAIDALQRAAVIRPEYRVLRNLAIAQQRADRAPDAYETCKRILAISDNDKWMITMKGQLEMTMGHLEDAEKSFRASLALDDQDWTVSVSLAKSIRGLGRNADAQLEIDKAKQIHPELAQVIDGFFKKP